MSTGLLIVYLVVVLGLIFEFLNGFHDAANAIATVVATRVLTPLAAVLMAGTLNLVGALSGTAVAVTSARASSIRTRPARRPSRSRYWARRSGI